MKLTNFVSVKVRLPALSEVVDVIHHTPSGTAIVRCRRIFYEEGIWYWGIVDRSGMSSLAGPVTHWKEIE